MNNHISMLRLGQNILINFEMEHPHLSILVLYQEFNLIHYVSIHMFNLNFKVVNIIHWLSHLKKDVIIMEIYIIIQKLLIQIFN